MKLTINDVKPIEDVPPLELFHQRNKSPVTDKVYTYMLRNMLCIVCEDMLNGTFEERAAEFVKRSRKDPAWCRSLLMGISKMMRGRSELPISHKDYLNPSSLPTYFAAIKKLLVMNEVPIEWKTITRTFPEKGNMRNARGWERDEIAQLLACAEGAKYRALILLLASSGIRVGAVSQHWGDFTPIYWNGDSLTDEPVNAGQMACAAVRVYAGCAEEYTTFVTPEAWNAIQEWRAVWAHDVGRQPKPTDPVFKQDGIFPVQLSKRGVISRLNDVIARSGLRSDHNKSGRRFSVPMVHGFRRFWNKTVKDALSDDSPVSSLTKKEYMLSHTGMTDMDRNYYHTNTLELAKEYVKAVPALTINNEERLQLEVLRNTSDSKKTKSLEERVTYMEKLIEDMSVRIASGWTHRA